MSELKIELTSNSRLSQTDLDNVKFGREFSDHMYVADFYDGEWRDFRIVPFENISVSPAFLSLHYAQSIFEGLKAHRQDNGNIVLFRADENFKRLNKSAERLCIPQIDEAQTLDALKKLIEIDKGWVPSKKGSSLYIRPFIFATDEFIGVAPSSKCRLIIFTCPVNSYYSAPVKVKIEEHYSRACNGGVGFAKAAGNYAASLYPAKLANEEGYDQLIWTDSKEHKYIEESGTMNLMVVINNTLITAETGDTILDGITRKSVLKLARDWGMNVEERRLSVEEVINAHKDGSLTEVFGTGTAVTICHIVQIGFRGERLELPPVEGREFSNKVKDYLSDLKKGKVEDTNNWIIPVI